MVVLLSGSFFPIVSSRLLELDSLESMLRRVGALALAIALIITPGRLVWGVEAAKRIVLVTAPASA